MRKINIITSTTFLLLFSLSVKATTYIDTIFYYSTQDIPANITISGLIESYIKTANQTFANSGLDVRVREATSFEVPFDNNDLRSIVRSMWGLTGNWVSVNIDKSYYGADVATYIKFAPPVNNYCGMASTLTSQKFPFGAIAIAYNESTCASPSIFIHEIGHTLGGKHDDDLYDSLVVENYAFGYKVPLAPVAQIGGETFTTLAIPSYSSDIRLPVFSSPNLNCGGPSVKVPCGDSSHDMVRTITQYASVVADAYPSVDSISYNTHGTFVADPQYSMSSANIPLYTPIPLPTLTEPDISLGESQATAEYDYLATYSLKKLREAIYSYRDYCSTGKTNFSFLNKAIVDYREVDASLNQMMVNAHLMRGSYKTLETPLIAYHSPMTTLGRFDNSSSRLEYDLIKAIADYRNEVTTGEVTYALHYYNKYLRELDTLESICREF